MSKQTETAHLNAKYQILISKIFSTAYLVKRETRCILLSYYDTLGTLSRETSSLIRREYNNVDARQMSSP